MHRAYQISLEVSDKVATKNKTAYDRRAHAALLAEGDRVLVRNLREKGGPGKLRSYWESAVYKVIERRGEGPVYVVEPESGGERRVLHRNHLLPVGCEFTVSEENSNECRQEEKKVEMGTKELTYGRGYSSDIVIIITKLSNHNQYAYKFVWR